MFNIGTIGTNEPRSPYMLHNLCNKIEQFRKGFNCKSSTLTLDSSKNTQRNSLGMVPNVSFIISGDFEKLRFSGQGLTFIVGKINNSEYFSCN